MFRPNERLVLTYPDSTIVQADPGFHVRQLVVRSTRDLVTQPLTVREYLQRPLLDRGRWIVRAFDLTTNSYRQFYVSNSLEHRIESPLRVGIYSKAGKKPLEVLPDFFESTKHDRIALAKFLMERFARFEHTPYELGIFSDDMRIVA